MLELVAFSVLGILLGTLTGLIPGLHVNTIAAVFISFGFGGLEIAVLFFSMAITHTFLDFIPAILLGVPSEDSLLSVLPGHELVLHGRGQEAILLTLIGSIGCLFIGVFLVPVFIFLVPLIYYQLHSYLGIILVLVSLYLVLLERRSSSALFCFLLSGILGFFVLRHTIISNPLLPLLTGLFGVSVILISLRKNSSIPLQVQVNLSLEEISFSSVFRGSFAGAIVGFLPGVGPSQAAVLSQALGRTEDPRQFLVTLGGINTANAIFALVAFLTIGKKRSGIVAGISDILPSFGQQDFLILLAAAVFAGGISFFLGVWLCRVAPGLLRCVDYRLLNLAVLFFIFALVLSLSGISGLLVLFAASGIGLLPHFLRIRKMHLMGVLIVPTALYFLGFV